MANPLEWNEGEGYDIHVLRGGPASKALDGSFKLDPDGLVPVFDPHFKGAPHEHGVAVDTFTGEVTATSHPDPLQPKLRNFLMTAHQTLVGDTLETMIRIHIHDFIQKIWLTPSTLTIHEHSDECQFTVLALFDDGVVGDITDWPQLTFTSADTAVATVLAGGIVVAEMGRPQVEMQVDITATLDLVQPATHKSTTAKAVTRNNWTSLGKKAPVQFVDGPVRPNVQDLTSSKPDSVKSVAEGRTNILFISEGFTQTQEKDFKTAVEFIVKTALQKNEFLQPFKLLKNSINYWSVFVRSQDDGISLLGDYEISGTSPKEIGTVVPRPEAPTAGSTQWSVANMIHEVGLPAPQDPVQSIPEWVIHWQKLYDTQVTAQLVATNFSDWNSLRSHSPLNERDSLFGIAHGTRARVSATGAGDPLLRPSWRRPSEASIHLGWDTTFHHSAFIESLTFGNPPPGGDPYDIGTTWARTEKDQGLVCFICLSDVGAGEARPGYFTASTGYERLARLTTATNGKDIQTAPLSDPKAPYSPDMHASRVAHECGHGFGLGDEYGPGGSAIFVLGSSAIPIYPNLQTKDTITSPGPGGTTVYDTSQIKWLRPRTIKVGLMERAPDDQGGNSFKMRMVPGHGKPFASGDLVLMRRAPFSKSDPFADIRFVVDRVWPDSVDVVHKSGPPLDVNLYDPAKVHVLICTSINPGVELKLIADPILNHIRTSGGPLNAPAGNPGAACVPSNNSASFMTPTNLPVLTFKKTPAAMADVIGIYEGGGHYDCGIYRPAGRCKMRTSEDKVIPFCQVCRYIIVDRVDPMMLAALDKMYDPYFPT